MVGIFVVALSTRDSIVTLADRLIREKGYNAFSFYDIAKTLGIKNASVHYYFPTKAHLAVAVIEKHIAQIDALEQETGLQTATDKLLAFMGIYSDTRAQNMICIVGSLASAYNTIETDIQKQITLFSEKVLLWLAGVLQNGLEQGEFYFETPARTKALMIITNLLAALQLTRLTGRDDFDTIREAIINDLKNDNTQRLNTYL